MGKPSFEDGAMLVGYRFHDPEARLATMRAGINSMVVDQAACAGPIHFMDLGGAGIAVCRGCGGQSILYRRADAIRAWAHKHRCESGKRFDENPGTVIAACLDRKV